MSFYWKLVSPIKLYDNNVGFIDKAEHVSIVRSIYGNMPNIMAKNSAHNSAILFVLPAGLSKSHNGNPAASLRIQTLYCVPRLLSGLPALVLSKSKKDVLYQHYKASLEKMQRVHRNSPEPVIFFLG